MKVKTEYPMLNTYKVFFNGLDVTNKCYEADDVLGICKCYKKNEAGEFYLEGAEVAQETLYGKVSIVAGL